jgi:glutathione S-transferase
MSELTLVIGNRNYSSWSMRAWLALEQTGAPFREQRIWFDEDGDRRQRLALSPAGRVPILRHGELTVWDSLAIAEYLAELYPDAGLWPARREARAVARALCAEMHSGFFEIRNRMPLNCRARTTPRDPHVELNAEVERIIQIWTETRRHHGKGGPYLFGKRTAADAFFAPVASRFQTYGVRLDGAAASYAEAVLQMPAVRDWIDKAESEGHPDPPYDAML